MNTLFVFDDKNYEPHWNRVCREAVRAVIWNGDRLALVRSTQEGFYKFPGGGIEKGESHLDALIRETAEEVGLHILPESVREFGLLREIRKSLFASDEIFDHTSYYYFADVSDESSAQHLDDYESTLGYTLEYTGAAHAWRVNQELAKLQETSFLLREAYILKLLMEGARS